MILPHITVDVWRVIFVIGTTLLGLALFMFLPYLRKFFPRLSEEQYRAFIFQGLVAALTGGTLVSISTVMIREKPPEMGRMSVGSLIPEVLKQDCEKLVQGQLLFTPQATMRQGTPYTVSARLSRGTDVHITSGLDDKGIVVENALVSCRVSMSLDSQEQDAFTIQKIPGDRADVQVLLPGQFDQWDWRVTPLNSGTLHLLLYVTPMLYIDGVGEGPKPFPQPARVITVSPDYLFAVKQFILRNWAIWGSILTALVIPALIWLVRRLRKRREEKHEKELAAQKKIGF